MSDSVEVSEERENNFSNKNAQPNQPDNSSGDKNLTATGSRGQQMKLTQNLCMGWPVPSAENQLRQILQVRHY